MDCYLIKSEKYTKYFLKMSVLSFKNTQLLFT